MMRASCCQLVTMTQKLPSVTKPDGKLQTRTCTPHYLQTMYISPTEAQPCCFHTAGCIALLRPLDVLTLTGLSFALHVDALNMSLWLCSTKSAHGCTCSSTRDTSSRLRCACASCSTASAAACRTCTCLVIAAVQMPGYQASDGGVGSVCSALQHAAVADAPR